MSVSFPLHSTRSSWLSPILFDSPSLSSFLWVCGILMGLGLVLAAYNPSDVSFLGPKPSDLNIYTCYSAGGLITLASAIQLLRLPSQIADKSPSLADLLAYVRKVPWKDHSAYQTAGQLRLEAEYIGKHAAVAAASAMQENQDALIVEFVTEIYALLKEEPLDSESDESILCNLLKEILIIVSPKKELIEPIIALYKHKPYFERVITAAVQYCVQQGVCHARPNAFRQVRHLLGYCTPLYIAELKHKIDVWAEGGNAAHKRLMHNLVEEHLRGRWAPL